MKAADTYTRLSLLLLGDPETFSSDNRSVNAISIISFLICLILLPFNIYLGFSLIVTMLSVLILLLGTLYYLSRFKKYFLVTSMLYAVVCYGTIITTFFINDGINGPTLMLCFLAFSLLIGFTSRKFHKYWIIINVIMGTGLLAYEYYIPNSVVQSYETRADRFVDFISSYVVTIIFMYLIILYLRNGYRKERRLVVARSKELEESNEQKTKLFSIVAHDLKTPLNGLVGYLELLNTYDIPEDQKKAVEKQLLISTKQTSEMLTNLLLWAKNQMGGIQPNIIDLPLQKTLAQTVINLKETAHAKNVNLRFHIDENAYVSGDRDMLILVVRNLIQNAIKFTPAKGSVVVSSETHDNFIRLVIIDNGVGIPEDLRSDLFTVKTKSSYGTDKEKGFGLGLLICKEFTEMQGGTIGYASMEQKGSKFFIDLPSVSAPTISLLKEKPAEVFA